MFYGSQPELNCTVVFDANIANEYRPKVKEAIREVVDAYNSAPDGSPQKQSIDSVSRFVITASFAEGESEISWEQTLGEAYADVNDPSTFGTIVLYRPALARGPSSDHLQQVVGHEVGHYDPKHMNSKRRGADGQLLPAQHKMLDRQAEKFLKSKGVLEESYTSPYIFRPN